MRTPNLPSVVSMIRAIVAIAFAAGAASAGATEIRTESQRLTWFDDSLPSGSEYGGSVALAAAGEMGFVGAPHGRSYTAWSFESGAWERNFDVTGGGDDPTLAACSNSFAGHTGVLFASRHIAGTYRVGPVTQSIPPYVSGIEDGPVEAVASFDNVIAFGQPGYDGGRGRIRIYENQGPGNWELSGEIVGPTGSQLGTSLGFVGPTLLAAGLPGLGENGAVQIYVNVSGWEPYQILEAPFCCSADARFGTSVAVAGRWIAVGAPGWDRLLAGGGSLPDVGNVALYLVTEFTWELVGFARPSEASADDEYGSSVALRPVGETGMVLLAGDAYDDISETNQGSAFVWWLVGGAWQAKWRLAATDGGAQDRLGTSVALGPRGALVGAPGAAANGVAEQGAAYFYAGVVPLFYDGVESGDTEAWSSVSP